MRVFIVGMLVAALAAGACGGQQKVRLTHRPNDIFGRMAAAAAEAPCAPSPVAGPVPTAPGKRPDNAFGYDVVFYFAHPEDETLFTPGTMDEFVAAKGRIFEVVLSHGEGGRLLERDATGNLREVIGAPPAKVAEVRDRELAQAMKALGIEYEHLYPATAHADFAAGDVKGPDRAVHSCGETLERWDALLPDGIAGLLKKLVASIRTRRPRLIVTHDHRDDDDWLDHGHHKAFGALVEMAARAAADPRVPGDPPHVIDEFVTIAPKQVPADVTLQTGAEMRKKLMAANASQFEAQKYAEISERAVERYVVRWRAVGLPPPRAGSLMASFANSR
ncbi:MAG TPA: PIG-L family deacetylase [Labilithrix sp.]|nr:PIG-L family deacetylase [Labilithrix sp.]